MQIQTVIIQKAVLKQRDDILIEQRNWLQHMDIEHDIQRINNGLHSFTLKVVNGEITDYMPIENARYNQP